MVVPRLRAPVDAAADALRIILVDRRPLFLAALAELLRGSCPQASIATVTDSETAMRLAADQSVDLLFCEARATPIAGAELASRITSQELATRVILLGDGEDQQLLIGSLACGAVGFFTKDASPDEFLEGVEAVLAGHFVVGRALLALTLTRLTEMPTSDADDRLGQLSEAERSILVMVGQAQSTRAIAASRGISQKTVRNHLASIYRKLAVRNRSEAIVWSARARLTGVPVD